MGKTSYKKTHRCIGSAGVGPVEVEGSLDVPHTFNRASDGLEVNTTRKKWVTLETRHGVIQVWVDVDAIIRKLGPRALRSTSGVAKTVSGAVQVRATDIKRTKVQS